MTPAYSDPLVTLYLGDCLDVMPTLEAESVDAVVTDPPYGLAFMGKHWDHGVPATPFWAEMYRVLKPGGYLLAFGGTRTVHRIATNIEDAGFEIRDMLMWVYASGFPKSLDVSKAIDKAAGAEREKRMVPTKLGNLPEQAGPIALGATGMTDTSEPITDAARKWDGWGTALKPAHEPIVMARKPLRGTVAANVLEYGTGAINVDGCRIGTEQAWRYPNGPKGNTDTSTIYGGGKGLPRREEPLDGPAGRWPSNVLLSDPELFDQPNPGVVGSGATASVNPGGVFGRDDNASRNLDYGYAERDVFGYGDSGGYSRFFRIPGYSQAEPPEGDPASPPATDGGRGEYPSAFIIPKSDRQERERGLGLHGRPAIPSDGVRRNRDAADSPGDGVVPKARLNTHPTVKPIDLMRHLVRLITPPGGVVLDPFLGSGTTCLAASEEGVRSIGIEREPEYLEIAKGRLVATPMGLGLDSPIVTPSPKQGNNTRKSKTARDGSTEAGYDGGWKGQPRAWGVTDEEPAA